MRIGFLMRRMTAEGTSVTTEVIRLLTEWGAEVDVLALDRRPARLADIDRGHDLYVLRSVTDVSLAYAGLLDATGARLVNPYPVARLCRDKALVTGLLDRAGVPVPESWVTDRPAQLAAPLRDGPLVVKPLHGSQGRGVSVVWDLDELLEVAAAGGAVLAQRYHRREGRDRKIYSIGGQLFGVKRVWPARTYAEKQGEPFTITDELRDIATTAGKALGTDLFGMDVVLSDGHLYVVDVNPFPGFKGVPQAALRLADYLFACAAQPQAVHPATAPSSRPVATHARKAAGSRSEALIMRELTWKPS